MGLNWCEPQQTIYFSGVRFLSDDMEDDSTYIPPYLHHSSLSLRLGGEGEKEHWRERCQFTLGSLCETLGNLTDLVQNFQNCLVTRWKLSLRENQVLCVPLSGSHPSIILLKVWFVLSFPSSCCSCFLCVPSDSVFIVSHLSHFLCAA